MSTSTRKLAARSQQLDNLWRKVVAAGRAHAAAPTAATKAALDAARIAWRNAS